MTGRIAASGRRRVSPTPVGTCPCLEYFFSPLPVKVEVPGRVVIQYDGSVQFPITSFGDPLDHLYEHLCALDNARVHGPESEWTIWDILEMRSCGRTIESICQHMLFPDGVLGLLWRLKTSLCWLQAIMK